MFATTLAAILSITTPASAAAPAGAPAPTAPTASAPTTTAKYNPRVCFVSQITGSLIRQRECRLLAQWRTDGIDPLPGK